MAKKTLPTPSHATNKKIFSQTVKMALYGGSQTHCLQLNFAKYNIF